MWTLLNRKPALPRGASVLCRGVENNEFTQVFQKILKGLNVVKFVKVVIYLKAGSLLPYTRLPCNAPA